MRPMRVHVLEAFCLLSARGYELRGGPVRGGRVAFIASRKMPDGGEANVHLDVPGDFSDVHASPETSMGSAGMKESGDCCALIGIVRAKGR